MPWIDIVIVVIILFAALKGLAKGFFDSILALCSVFVSLFIAVKAANWFAGILRSIVDIDGWFNSLLVNQLGVGDSLVFLGKSYPREKVAAFLTVLLAGILLFIFIRIIIRLLKNMFTAATENSKTLGGLNKLLGLVFGALKGSIVVVLALSVCSIIISLGLPGVSTKLQAEIDKNKATSFVYGYVDQFVDDRIAGKDINDIIHGLFDKDKANQQEENTKLQVIYHKDSPNCWIFTKGETVDYSDITIMYIAGKDVAPQLTEISESNFSEPINTSEVVTNKKVTITAHGLTVDFYYSVQDNA